MKTYSEETIKLDLKKLKDWEFAANGIEKKLVFSDFSQALGFIV